MHGFARIRPPAAERNAKLSVDKEFVTIIQETCNQAIKHNLILENKFVNSDKLVVFFQSARKNDLTHLKPVKLTYY